MTRTDDLRRLTEESRARVAAAAVLREQYQVIAGQTRRRCAESRALLERSVARVPV